MAYDYDVDILAALWTGAEDAEEPYASFLAANPDITNEVSELRILSTIELFRSHIELIQNRDEAKLLRESISKLITHTAGGSDPFGPAAAITTAEGNVKQPNFPAGANLLFENKNNGVCVSATSATGGDLNTVIGELNADFAAGGAPTAEVTDITIPDDSPDGSLQGTHFTINSANDATAYYVWFDNPGRPEVFSIINVAPGVAYPAAGPAAYFTFADDMIPGGSGPLPYYVWYALGTAVDPIPPPSTPAEGIMVTLTGAEPPFGPGSVADKTATAISAFMGGAIATATFDGPPFGAGHIEVTMTKVGNPTDYTALPLGPTHVLVLGLMTPIGTTVPGIAAAVDPAPGGTGITVAYTLGDTGTEIDGAVSSAIGALGDFSSESGTFAPGGSLGSVTVTNSATGPTTDAADVDAGVLISVTTQGTASSGPSQIEAFRTSDGRLGFRTTEDFVTFCLSNGTGGIIGPAGVIPGERASTPKRVADQGRDSATSHNVGTPRPADLTP